MSEGNGKLGEDSFNAKDGNVDIAIGQQSGRVVLKFFRPIDEIVFDPVNAVTIGKQLIDVGVACGAQVTIQVPKRKITREQRERLVTRATHVFRSMTEKGNTPSKIARNVVDTILSAID